jgi:hypothetical protein
MDNQGIYGRPPLDFKNACDRDRIARIRSQAINGFGGENNQAAAAQHFRGHADRSLIRSLNDARRIQPNPLGSIV